MEHKYRLVQDSIKGKVEGQQGGRRIFWLANLQCFYQIAEGLSKLPSCLPTSGTDKATKKKMLEGRFQLVVVFCFYVSPAEEQGPRVCIILLYNSFLDAYDLQVVSMAIHPPLSWTPTRSFPSRVYSEALPATESELVLAACPYQRKSASCSAWMQCLTCGHF